VRRETRRRFVPSTALTSSSTSAATAAQWLFGSVSVRRKHAISRALSDRAWYYGAQLLTLRLQTPRRHNPLLRAVPQSLRSLPAHGRAGDPAALPVRSGGRGTARGHAMPARRGAPKERRGVRAGLWCVPERPDLLESNVGAACCKSPRCRVYN
jgi:hypothetical protein